MPGNGTRLSDATSSLSSGASSARGVFIVRIPKREMIGVSAVVMVRNMVIDIATSPAAKMMPLYFVTKCIIYGGR